MESTLPVVEITIKPEPIECENSGENEQHEYNQITMQVSVKEEELWIKPELLEAEHDSQDSIKDEDLGTLSENEARVDEEALNDDLNRNRQSNAPSRKQIMVFLDFLNEQRELANCMLRGQTGRAKAHQLWEDIAERLNNISGCHKTTQQWQRVWSDKKYLTRKAAAARFASLTAGGPQAPELTLQDEKILEILGEPVPPRRVCQKPATPEPKQQTPNQPDNVLVIPGPSKRGPANPELESQLTMPEQIIPQIEAPLLPSRPPRKPYTPRKEASRKSDIPQSDVPPMQPDVAKPPDDQPETVVRKLDEPLPSPSIVDLPSPPQTPPDKQTNDQKSSLPLKKRLENRVKLEDEVFPKQEIPEEKSDAEANEQREDNSQPQMETPLMYSYETLKNIEIVTIDEEERQEEYQKTLKAREHMRHVCVHCAVGFVLKQAFDMHMKVHSPESGDHECLICYSRLKTADMLYKHRLRHYRRYRCLLCRMRFKDKDSAACHVMNDHTGQTFECDRCGRGFKRPQYLKKHVAQHHVKSLELECGICFRVFHERGWYRSHIRTHNEEIRAKTVVIPVTCEICSREFKNKSSLKRHLLTHDEDVHCEICFEKCKNRVTLGNHYLKVHQEKYDGQNKPERKTNKKVLVDKNSAQKSYKSLERNQSKEKNVMISKTSAQRSKEYRERQKAKNNKIKTISKTDAQRSKEYRDRQKAKKKIQLQVENVDRLQSAAEQTCSVCDRICATRAMLKRHMQRMHGDKTKKYQCDHCQRLYLTKGEVRAHITWSHMPAEARGGHACTCGRIFRSPSLLRDHKARFHAAEPPPRVHQCEHCEKAFANKQVLNRHKKSHSNEMYPCKECGLLFKTQPYVKIHYQIKHLNMTRAQIKAQGKQRKEQLLQTNTNRGTNWEPHISNKKNCSVAVENEEDPLLVQEGDVPIKLEEEEEFKVPTFQTFIDISRDE